MLYPSTITSGAAAVRFSITSQSGFCPFRLRSSAFNSISSSSDDIQGKYSKEEKRLRFQDLLYRRISNVKWIFI